MIFQIYKMGRKVLDFIFVNRYLINNLEKDLIFLQSKEKMQ